MPIRHRYIDHGDACAMAHAMDVIGDRWALIVVRELILGPKRFADLRRALPGITPAVLSTRLHELEAAGVLTTPHVKGTQGYRLTPWGQDLQPVLTALGTWAQASPTRPGSGYLTPDAAALTTQMMAPATRHATVTFGLTLVDDRDPSRPAHYQVAWSPRAVDVARIESPPEADVTYGAIQWVDLLMGDGTATEPRSGTAHADERALELVRDFRQERTH